jgi:recombination associated protein RdgC
MRDGRARCQWIFGGQPAPRTVRTNSDAGARAPWYAARVSALKGSLSYSRLFVEGDLPRDFRDRFTKALHLRAMKPLTPDEDAIERSGWCVMGDPFDVDVSYESVFQNEFLNLGFRTDKWRVPTSMLRAKVREAESAALGRKGRERLSRQEKAELKELVTKKLRRQLPPVTRAVDFSWSLDEGLIRFFSHADKTIAAMSELFEQTFRLKLALEAPYTLAARLGLTKAEETAWESVEPFAL